MDAVNNKNQKHHFRTNIFGTKQTEGINDNLQTSRNQILYKLDAKIWN